MRDLRPVALELILIGGLIVAVPGTLLFLVLTHMTW